jgi:hypothetical protein
VNFVVAFLVDKGHPRAARAYQAMVEAVRDSARLKLVTSSHWWVLRD